MVAINYTFIIKCVIYNILTLTKLFFLLAFNIIIIAAQQLLPCTLYINENKKQRKINQYIIKQINKSRTNVTNKALFIPFTPLFKF